MPNWDANFSEKKSEFSWNEDAGHPESSKEGKDDDNAPEGFLSWEDLQNKTGGNEIGEGSVVLKDIPLPEPASVQETPVESELPPVEAQLPPQIEPEPEFEPSVPPLQFDYSQGTSLPPLEEAPQEVTAEQPQEKSQPSDIQEPVFHQETPVQDIQPMSPFGIQEEPQINPADIRKSDPSMIQQLSPGNLPDWDAHREAGDEIQRMSPEEYAASKGIKMPSLDEDRYDAVMDHEEVSVRADRIEEPEDEEESETGGGGIQLSSTEWESMKTQKEERKRPPMRVETNEVEAPDIQSDIPSGVVSFNEPLVKITKLKPDPEPQKKSRISTLISKQGPKPMRWHGRSRKKSGSFWSKIKNTLKEKMDVMKQKRQKGDMENKEKQGKKFLLKGLFEKIKKRKEEEKKKKEQEKERNLEWFEKFKGFAVKKGQQESLRKTAQVQKPSVQTPKEGNEAEKAAPKPFKVEKVEADKPRVRRAIPPQRASAPKEQRSIRERLQPVLGKNMLIGIGVVALILLLIGVVITLRETRVKVRIDSGSLVLNPEGRVVLGFKERMNLIRRSLQERQRPVQKILDETVASLNAAQADRAGRTQSKKLLDDSIEQDKQQIEEVLDTTQGELEKLWDKESRSLNEEYESSKAEINAKIKERAEFLKLNYKPNSELDLPEVTVNAFRLSLYDAPEKVDVTAERQWAEKLLKLWREMEEGWAERRKVIRDRAKGVREPVGKKIQETRDRIKNLREEIAGINSNLDLINVEITNYQSRMEELKEELEETFKPFYKELLNTPDEYLRYSQKIDSNGVLDMRRLESKEELVPGVYTILISATKDGKEYWALKDFELIPHRAIELKIEPEDFVPARSLIE